MVRWWVQWSMIMKNQIIMTNWGFVRLFENEIVPKNNNQILENVPESKEGEADKKAKGAANVRDQWDNVIADHLMTNCISGHCTVHQKKSLNAFTSFLTEIATEA